MFLLMECQAGLAKDSGTQFAAFSVRRAKSDSAIRTLRIGRAATRSTKGIIQASSFENAAVPAHSWWWETISLASLGGRFLVGLGFRIRLCQFP